MPTFLTILNQLGLAYYKQGELGKAEHYLTEALDLIKENPSLDSAKGDILYDLGNVYYSLGQYQEAIAFQEQALAIKKELELPLEVMPYPQCLKSLIRFAQRGCYFGGGLRVGGDDD